MTEITVAIDDSLNTRFESEAQRLGVPPSAVIGRVLAEHFDEQPSGRNALELARELGLVGFLKGLPADLSTNPKYLEGFGE